MILVRHEKLGSKAVRLFVKAMSSISLLTSVTSATGQNSGNGMIAFATPELYIGVNLDADTFGTHAVNIQLNTAIDPDLLEKMVKILVSVYALFNLAAEADGTPLLEPKAAVHQQPNINLGRQWEVSNYAEMVDLWILEFHGKPGTAFIHAGVLNLPGIVTEPTSRQKSPLDGMVPIRYFTFPDSLLPTVKDRLRGSEAYGVGPNDWNIVAACPFGKVTLNPDENELTVWKKVDLERENVVPFLVFAETVYLVCKEILPIGFKARKRHEQVVTSQGICMNVACQEQFFDALVHLCEESSYDNLDPDFDYPIAFPVLVTMPHHDYRTNFVYIYPNRTVHT